MKTKNDEDLINEGFVEMEGINIFYRETGSENMDVFYLM